MKIGVVPGTTGERFAHLRAKAAGLPLEVFKTCNGESALLPDLMSGKVDAIARGEIGNDYQAMINPGVVTIDKYDFHEGFVFAIDGNNKQLVTAINHAIEDITDHGRITYSQWLQNPDVFAQRLRQLNKT